MGVIRCALLGVAGLALAALAIHVFNDRAFEIVIVPVLVTAAAMITSRLGTWSQIGAIGIAIVAGTFGVALFADGSWGDVVPGIARGPRRLLSTEWPSPLEPSMIVTLAFLVGVCTSTALLLAVRERWRLLPLLPILLGATVLVALSAPDPPSVWTLVTLGVVMIAFALTGQAPPGAPRSTGIQVDRTVVATVAAVTATTLLTAGAVVWADRADPRATDEPEVTETLLDPIEATVAMRNADPVIDLMTITDRSPRDRPSMPRRWRLAAFDQYDGQRWVPSVELNQIGGVLGVPPQEASTLVYTVEYHGDWIDLVPFPGRPISVDRDVQTDLDRVAVRLVESPDAGTVVEAAAVPDPPIADVEGLGFANRQVDEIAVNFSDQARRIAGSGMSVDQLRELARTMRATWQLDSSAPGSGLQQALISRFITDTQRGTREQFVTAYVLLARSLGFDARVAAGFSLDTGDLDSDFVIRSEHAAIWPEVRLDGDTWLAFNPVPANEVTEEVEDDPPPQAQSPAAPQPPIAPPADDETSDDDVVLDEETAADGLGTVGRWAVRAGVSLGAILTPIALVVGVILWLKWRRRRSRLRASEPGVRVRGAWANTTDSLVDAGLDIPRSWTDDHIAVASENVVAGAPHEARRLAAMSSAVTFGPSRDDEAAQLAIDASATSASIDEAYRGSHTRWERVKWRLSLRSLRPSTRSPVT